jgi:hypothetical protein
MPTGQDIDHSHFLTFLGDQVVWRVQGRSQITEKHVEG